MLCIHSFELFFFWHKCSTAVAVGVQTSFLPFAKSVTEKNNRSVDCAEADKKTVQAQRYEGRGFLAAGDLPRCAARNYLTGLPDRFLYKTKTDQFIELVCLRASWSCFKILLLH